MIVGVTGNIGSGKSFVAGELARILDAELCDADSLCRSYMQKDNPGYRAVLQKWGDRFLSTTGDIDTVKLRSAIFEDNRIREELEGILHPLVQKHIEERIVICTRDGKWLVAEIPLLFEKGWQSMFETVIAVYADNKTVVERVMARDGVSADQVQRSLAVQMGIEDKIRLSDYVVDNNCSIESTLQQIENIQTVLLGG